MTPTTYPLIAIVTPASLAALAARYPDAVAQAARLRDLTWPMPTWHAPVDRELERLMQAKPEGARRVA